MSEGKTCTSAPMPETEKEEEEETGREPLPILGREAVLSALDLPREPVAVPEWGGVVLIRSWTGAERDAWEKLQQRLGQDEMTVRARLVIATACDSEGRALFGEADIPALMGKNAKALARLSQAALRLNFLTDQDIRELTASFFVGPSGGPGSGSP